MENLCNVPIRVIETRFSSFFFSLSLLFHWDITIIWNRVNQDGWDKSLIRFFIEMYLLILSPVNLRSKWEASRSCCSKLYRFFAEELEEKETRSRCGDFRVDDSLIIYPEIFEVESRHPGGTETPCIVPKIETLHQRFARFLLPLCSHRKFDGTWEMEEEKEEDKNVWGDVVDIYSRSVRERFVPA